LLTIFSRSLAAKVLLALTLVLLVMGASYFVLNKRLQRIETSFNDISRISNYAVGILRINKDIVEMQRAFILSKFSIILLNTVLLPENP